MLSMVLIVAISFYFQFISIKADSDGVVRLYRNGVADTSQSWSSGIVQIYYSGQWGNICDDFYFGSDEADVICRQLGYTGASSYSNTGLTSTWGTDSSPTRMDDVSCPLFSSYLTITQCSFSSTFISSICTNSRDVTVSCFSSRLSDSPSTGDIRLTGGTYSNQGLLEVYCNGQWGTVCDDHFDATEARVACRQLGYNSYDNFEHLSQRGTTDQSIWLRDLYSCSSSRTCLTSCDSCPTRSVSSCIHSEDVTLACDYSSSNSDVTTTTSTNCDISTSVAGGRSTSSATLEAVVIGTVIGIIVCIVIIIAVPICICVCFGVAIGATTRRRGVRTHYVAPPTATTTTTAAVVTTTTTNTTVGYTPDTGRTGGGAVYYPADNSKGSVQQQQSDLTTQAPPSYSSLPQEPPPPAGQQAPPTAYPTQQAPPTAYSTTEQAPYPGGYPPTGYSVQQAPPTGNPAYPQQPPEAYPPPT